MVLVRLAPNAQRGKDVTLPETVAHRSVKGDTLLFRPGANQELTDEEWQFVQDVHPDLVAQLEVLRR